MARKSRSRIAPPRRPSTNVIATVAVVVLAVVVIGGVLLFNRADDDGGGTGFGAIPTELRAGPDSNTLTEADGDKVTVVEFLDYQCPACAASAVQQRIDADVAAGEKLGVSSTPTIFVNGKKFEPRGDSFADVDRELRDLVDEALG